MRTLQYYICYQGVAAKQAKNSSVKKLILLGVLPDVPENYFNVQAILSNLNLTAIEFTAAADLKMCKCLEIFSITIPKVKNIRKIISYIHFQLFRYDVNWQVSR